MERQRLLSPEREYSEVLDYLQKSGAKHVFLVCGSSIQNLALDGFFRRLPQKAGIQVTRFSQFQPNPDWQSVEKAVDCFKGCDAITAVGGGSAIDVAKCVRLFSNGEPVPFVAVPTTAGSGSEATRFAVLYRDGIKQSVENEICMPSAVLLDPSVLRTLPVFQRKCTMLDTLCHAVESFWARGASDESRRYSKEALQLFFCSQNGYLLNEDAGNAGMQLAAYTAGKAINLAKTTAAHAMAYGMTKKYGLPHGCAAAMCLSKIWLYILSEAQEKKNDVLVKILDELAFAFECMNAKTAVERFSALLNSLQLPRPAVYESDIASLCDTINEERLGNSPILLDREAIEMLYRQILL